MKKFITIFACVFVIANTAFSKPWDIYDGADEGTLQCIREYNEAVENKQYQTAIYKIGGCSNEYLTYAYIECCTQYFLFSMMHEMFGFKDLEEGEDLMTLRKGATDTTFNLAYRATPEEILENCRKECGDSIVLDLARANYYFDAILRYGDQWTKTPNEVIDIVLPIYEKAVEAQIYDERVLANYSTLAMNMGDYEGGENAYNLLTQKFPENGTYWYNYVVTLMYQGKYEEAKIVGKEMVEHPEEDVSYQIDGYLLYADTYSYTSDYENAEKVLLEAKEKYQNECRIINRLGELYLAFGDNYNIDKANEYLSLSLKTSCDEQNIYDCINLFMSQDKIDEAIKFCESNIKSNKNKDNKGMIGFYEAQIYLVMNDIENAKKCAELAKKNFKKAKNSEGMDGCDRLLSSIAGQSEQQE